MMGAGGVQFQDKIKMKSWAKDKSTKNIQHMFVLYLQPGF